MRFISPRKSNWNVLSFYRSGWMTVISRIKFRLYKWLFVFFPHGLTQTRPFASWTLRSLLLKAKSQLTCHHVCFKQSERYNYAIAIIGSSRDKQIWCLREVVTETRVNMRFLRSNSKIPCRKLVEIYKIYRFLLYQINKGKKKLDHGAITQNNIRENYDAFSIIVLNPFTPKSDQSKNSPAASPAILHHTVWRICLFIACSDERWFYYQFSLPHLYISL